MDMYYDEIGLVEIDNDGYSQFDDDLYPGRGEGHKAKVGEMSFEDSIDTNSQTIPQRIIPLKCTSVRPGNNGVTTSTEFTDVSYLEESHSPYDDGLDTRKFRNEAYTMLNSGLAINKTLKKAFRTKTTQSHNPPSMATGVDNLRNLPTKSIKKKTGPGSNLIDASLSSSGSASLAPLSLGSGQFQTQSQVLPIPIETKLLSACWEAFIMSGIPQEVGVNHFDGCNITLPVNRIVSSLEKISSSIIISKVEELVKQHFPKSNASLSWPEYRNMALEIFSDSQFFHSSPILSPSKSTLPQPNIIGHDHSFMGRGGDIDLSRHNGRSVDIERRFKSPFSSIGNRFTQPPYKQLIQKQRSAGGADQQTVSITPCNGTASNIINDTSAINDNLPSQKVKDVAIEQMKKQWRNQRKLMKRVDSALQKEGMGHALLDASTLSTIIQEENKESPAETVKLYASAIIDSMKEPGFCQPLLKQKVFELGNSRHRYSDKWESMREKREERYQREQHRADRNRLLTMFNRTVFTEEKCALRKFMYDRDCIVQEENKNRYRQRRREQAIVQEHILSKKHEDTLRLSEKAAALRDALQVITNSICSSQTEDNFNSRNRLQICILYIYSLLVELQRVQLMMKSNILAE